MTTIVCPTCHGNGKVPGMFHIPHHCTQCEGEGRIPAPPPWDETQPAFHFDPVQAATVEAVITR